MGLIVSFSDGAGANRGPNRPPSAPHAHGRAAGKGLWPRVAEHDVLLIKIELARLVVRCVRVHWFESSSVQDSDNKLLKLSVIAGGNI